MKLLLEGWRKYLNEARVPMLKDAIREIPSGVIISPDADVAAIHVYNHDGENIGEYSLWDPVQGVVDLEQLEGLRSLGVEVRIYRQEKSLDNLKDFFAARIKQQEKEEEEEDF